MPWQNLPVSIAIVVCVTGIGALPHGVHLLFNSGEVSKEIHFILFSLPPNSQFNRKLFTAEADSEG